MTVTHRKRQYQPEEIQSECSWSSCCCASSHAPFLRKWYVPAVNEPGLQIQCDGCGCDLTHSIRIKCADPVCELGDGVDICPACFCSGKEFGRHKRCHEYRVVVSLPEVVLFSVGKYNKQELHSYPIFSEDWGADE